MKITKSPHRNRWSALLGPLSLALASSLTVSLNAQSCLAASTSTTDLVGNSEPSSVALIEAGLPESGYVNCKGVGIGPRTVLTAAHCVIGYRSSDIRVHINNVLLQVHDIAIHPQYQAQLEPQQFPRFDIAVLSTTEPINVEQMEVLTSRSIKAGVPFQVFDRGEGSLRPIRLSPHKVQLQAATNESVVRTLLAAEPIAPRSPELIKKLTASLNAGGERFKQKLDSDFSGYLFSLAETDGASICLGDSGGPAFLDVDGHPTVIAVTSAVSALEEPSPPGCQTGAVSIFTALADPATAKFLRQFDPEIRQR